MSQRHLRAPQNLKQERFGAQRDNDLQSNGQAGAGDAAGQGVGWPVRLNGYDHTAAVS